MKRVLITTTGDGTTVTIGMEIRQESDLPENPLHARMARAQSHEELAQSLAPMVADMVFQYYHHEVLSGGIGIEHEETLRMHYLGIVTSFFEPAKQLAKGMADNHRRAGTLPE